MKPRPAARAGEVSALVDRIARDVDRAVRRGRNGLRYAAGTKRLTVGQTPKDIVWQRDKAQLWRYRRGEIRYAQPVVIVHSLISRSYVLDLYPGNSLVQFLQDAGFEVYSQTLSVRPDMLEELRPCLEAFVPLVQQSAIDYLDAPARANEMIIDAVAQFDTFWTYDEGLAEYSVQTQK